MEDLVRYQGSSADYFEIATIIERFLDGTGDRWAWDDFISGRRFKDEHLREIQLQCDLIPIRYPATQLGHYCNEDGLLLLQSIAEDLRKGAASDSLSEELRGI